MSYVITLIAPQQAPFFEEGPLKNLGLNGERKILQQGRAVDLVTDTPASAAQMDAVRTQFHIDILCQPLESRKKRLFIADMDATMVEEETLDELAAFAGIRDQIAAITARAMNGELDFGAALRERVGLLKGLPAAALSETAAKMHYTQGGKELIAALKSNGVHCILVSGGFTYFTSKVAETLEFDANHGNILNMAADQTLLGTVGEPILDKTFKKACLIENAAKLGIDLSACVAIGDGANDLPMLQTAGLGVGFHSKQVLRDALPNHILFSGLDALIYALGLH